MFSLLWRRGDTGNVLYSYDARGTSYIFQRLFRVYLLWMYTYFRFNGS